VLASVHETAEGLTGRVSRRRNGKRVPTIGYDVVESANAAEAVEVFAAGTVIDLVFSDINFIPGPPNSMDGVGLARWVSQHHPGVHVILASGKSKSLAARADVAAFLPKPYRVREALLLISALLEDPQQGDDE